MLLLVTALAGGLRFWHLSFPHSYVFDEVYYAKDGCYDAGYPWQQCGLSQPGEQTFTVHPPLARWIIAGGERLFGNNSFGWRVSSATFGTLSVLILALIALRLFRSVLWAGISGLLLATEGLNLVQSRVSMLDIFITTFALAGFLCLILDREWIERRTPVLTPLERATAIQTDVLYADLPGQDVPAPLLRPWRIAAGVMLGAATASKWSGALALVAGIVLTVMWERGRRRAAGLRHPLLEAIRQEAGGIVLFLGLLPVAVYVASYLRWWIDNGFAPGAFYAVQKGMAEYSLHLHATHPYASRPNRWFIISRPVAFYYVCAQKAANGACLRAAEILDLGNPLIFWGSIIAIPVAFVGWVRRRDWRPGFIVVAVLVQYLPWYLASRTSFFFYMTPISPLLVLAVAYALRRLSAVRVGVTTTDPEGATLAPIAAAAVVVSVALFAFFWPVLVGDTISQAAWHARIWFYCPTYHGICQWNWV